MIRVLYLEAPVVVCSDFQCQELLGCTRKGRRKSETQCFKPCVLLIVFARVHKEARGFLKGGQIVENIFFLTSNLAWIFPSLAAYYPKVPYWDPR